MGERTMDPNALPAMQMLMNIDRYFIKDMTAKWSILPVNASVFADNRSNNFDTLDLLTRFFRTANPYLKLVLDVLLSKNWLDFFQLM